MLKKESKVMMNFNKKTHLRCVSKPNFILQKIFNKNFVAIHCVKAVLTLKKLIYVGFSILEFSKPLMYQFHDDYVLKTFNSVKLLFTDTGSLVYKIKDSNVFDQCFKDKHLFDFSECSKGSVHYDSFNKKVVEKMKNELNGVKMLHLLV